MAAAAQAFVQAGFTPVSGAGVSTPPPPTPAPPVKTAPAPATPPPAPPSGESAVIKPAEQAAATPTPPQPVEDIFKNIGGGKFKSADELNAHLEELDKKTKENPFANDRIQKINELVRNGIDPDVAYQTTGINLDKLSPKELLVKQLQIRDKLSADDAEILVNEQYRLDDDIFSNDDPATKAARIKAKVDANGAKEFLQQHIADAQTPPIEKQIEKQVQAWTPVIPQVMDSFKSMSFSTKNGEYTFPVSPETQAAAAGLLNEVIQSGMVDAMPDKEGIEFAKAVVQKEILQREVGNIIDNVVDQIRAAEIAGKHNPRVNSPGTPPPPDDKKGLYDFMAGMHGIKLNQS